MPTIDWSWLEAINLFQVAVVITSMFVITRMLMRFWPWLRKVMALTSALAQLPDFIDRTDTALQEQGGMLAEQAQRIGEIHHETHHNNGSSLKDAQARTEEAVERIELGMKSIHEKVDEQKIALEKADDDLRHDLEMTTPPARKRATQPKENQ